MKYRHITIIWDAIQIVFKQKKYLFGLIGSIIVIFWLFILIPVIIVPGNDIPFQLSIMPKKDFIILLLLAIITGVTLLFHLYIMRRKKAHQIKQLGYTTISGGSSIISSFLGTVTCISCASTVLGFLGVGTVTFALKYRFILTSISILTMVVSLYFTSKNVLNVCDRCQVKYTI